MHPLTRVLLRTHGDQFGRANGRPREPKECGRHPSSNSLMRIAGIFGCRRDEATDDTAEARSRDIQGDVFAASTEKLLRLFLFFKIVEQSEFNLGNRISHVVGSTDHQRSDKLSQCDLEIGRRKHRGRQTCRSFHGLNSGLHQGWPRSTYLTAGRPLLESAFERGADHQDTIRILNDPPISRLAGRIRSRPDRRRFFNHRP